MSDESLLRNKTNLKWEKMLPEFGEDSPVYAILRVDPATDATTLVIEFPTAIHIPKHTHEKSETHFLLEGSHLFENNATGERVLRAVCRARFCTFVVVPLCGSILG